MAVRPMHLVLFVFQIILEIGSGYKLPLATGIYETDPSNIQSDLPFVDDKLQSINPIESSRILPSFLSVNVPNIDNSFKLVLSYGEECAMKYRQLKKLQCFEGPQSFAPANPCLLPTVIPPSLEFNFPVNEFIPSPTSSGLRLPLQVSSSVTALDQITKVTDSNPCFSTTPPTCFNTFNPEYIPYSALPLPLTYSSSSSLDLARSVEVLESLFSPTLAEQLLPSAPVSVIPPQSVPAITAMMEPNINTPLLSPRSTFTLPLAVTSTTYDIKPSPLFENCSPIIPNIPSYSNIPAMTLNNDELFVPTPNTLPYPLIPLLTNQGINSGTPISMDYTNSAVLYNTNQLICPPLIDSELPFYNCPIVPTSAQNIPVLVSCRGFYQGSTNLPSLGTKLTSPLFRNCHTLKPLPVCTNTLSPTCPLSNSFPVSDFDLCTLPPVLSTTASPSIIDSTLANTYKMAQILEDSYTSSNSLSFTTLPSDLSSVESVSNSLSSTPNKPLLPSNSLLLFDDFPNSISEPFCNSFKRSPNINEAPKPSNNPVLDIVSMDVNKLDSNNYTKSLRELISLVEMLVNDYVDERTINDILSMLSDCTLLRYIPTKILSNCTSL